MLFVQKTALALALLLVFSAFFVGGSSVAVAGAAEKLDMISHFNIDIAYVNVSGGALGEVIVNVTRIPNQKISVDGVTDVYKVELFSNGQVIGSNIRGCTIGAGLSLDYLMGLSMSLGHVGTRNVESNGSTLITWDIWYDPMNPQFVEPLTVSLSRMGWIVIDGNDTSSNLHLNDKIQQVTLVKAQSSYIYGNLPPKAAPTSSPPSSANPSQTQEPVSSLELTPALTTALVVAVVLVVFSYVAVIYVRKRRFRPESVSPADSAEPLGSQAPHQ